MSFAFAIAALLVTPGTATLTAPAQPEIIKSGLDPSQRMTIPIRVNGAGPFDFTIDTGADRSVVSDHLANALALPPGKSIRLTSVTGELEVATAKVDRLQFGSNDRRSLSAAVLPEHALGAIGFLGTDMLAGRTLLLDFRQNRVSVGASAGFTGGGAMVANPVEGATITIVARRRFGQLILADARINNIRLYAIIDTGAQNTIGNLRLRDLLMGKTPATHSTNLIGVTGGSIPCETASIPRITLGSLEIAHMPIGYADAITFHRFHIDDVPAILLGMDVLRTFATVSVDFGRREVRFELS